MKPRHAGVARGALRARRTRWNKVSWLALGAMALSYCPDMKALHEGFYDESAFALPEKLLMGSHPGFPASDALVGLSARAVVETGETPLVELGLVEKSGEAGGLGAGLYRPPVQPFANAVEALQT